MNTTTQHTITFDAIANYLSEHFKWVSSNTLKNNADTPVSKLGVDGFDLITAVEGLKDEFGLRSKLTERAKPLKSPTTTAHQIAEFVYINQA